MLIVTSYQFAESSLIISAFLQFKSPKGPAALIIFFLFLFLLHSISYNKIHICFFKTDREPFRFETPYGKRLSFAIKDPYEIVVHLKDKQKIRHKKRWSQVSNELLGKFINLLVLFDSCEEKGET